MRSLANKVRPATFESAIGEAAKKNGGIIRNQLRTGNISHAYLFDGLRGSGKTTTARTLAKALNCLNLKDGEPCNCCENCRKIDEGSSTDVKEVDAARNNGVEYAKQLEEDAAYKPVEMKKKVFILDECHCMTQEAFSSLLKLIETPPEWCVFIFCTTDPQKLPDTIRSRCQRYSFKGVSIKEMSAHLINIVNEVGARIEPAAAETIARHSGGSVRDAVVALETCLSEEADITESRVNEILGVESWEQIFMLINAITDGNRRFLINCVDRWYNEGRKITDVLSDCLMAVTDRLRFLAGAEPNGNENYVGFIKNSKLGEGKAFVLAEGFRETYEKMRYNPDRGVLTVSLLKISAQKEDVSFANEEDILNRLSDAEKEISHLKSEIEKLRNGIPAVNTVQGQQPTTVQMAQPNVPMLDTVMVPDVGEMFGSMFGFTEPMPELSVKCGNTCGTAEEAETEISVTESQQPVMTDGKTKSNYSLNPLDDVDIDDCPDDEVIEVRVPREVVDADITEGYEDTPVEEYTEAYEEKYTDVPIECPDGFAPAYDIELPEGFLNEPEPVVDYPEPAAETETADAVPEMPAEAVSETVAETADETQGENETVLISGPSFTSLDALFNHINNNASEIQKLDWKIQEDELWSMIASYCQRETVNGTVVFKTQKQNVADAMKKKINEHGFAHIAEVMVVNE